MTINTVERREELLKRLLTALLLTAALLLSAPAASAASLSVNRPPGGVSAGESFAVTVELEGSEAFCAAQFILAFDREKLECVEASPGPLLEGMLSAVNPDAPEGAAVAAVSTEPVQGGGVLGTFRFTAKTSLDSPRFTLKDALLADENGEELEVSLAVDAAQEEAPQTPGAPETPAAPETPDAPAVPETPADPASPAGPAVPVDPPAQTPSFSDIGGHWAAESIRKAAEKGLIGGYADGTFRPNQPVTRKQMAVILWRMAGKPQPAASAPFKDLDGCGEEFRNAIAWGYGKGLLSGTGSDTFSPDAALTRQAAMKLLFGYAGGQAGPEALLYATYDGTYTDSAQISEWGRAPVYWGVYNGILSGNGQSLNPRGTVTRAQLAAILVRYLDRGGI